MCHLEGIAWCDGARASRHFGDFNILQEAQFLLVRGRDALSFADIVWLGARGVGARQCLLRRLVSRRCGLGSRRERHRRERSRRNQREPRRSRGIRSSERDAGTLLWCLQGTCRVDQCITDSDCATGTACGCAGAVTGLLANACVASGCRVDPDCGACGLCSPTVALGGPFNGYECRTATDSCTSDVDCMADQNDSNYVWCDYSGPVTGGGHTCRTLAMPTRTASGRLGSSAP